MVSKQPRKQRKALYTAPIHRKRKIMAAHLSEELRSRYGVRAVPIRKGDVVMITRGDMKGHVGEVVEVDRKSMTVAVEGATRTKADGTQVPRKIHPSNLIITKLNLADPLRKKKLESLKGGKE
mgnify:CR=1 FL=1